MKKSKSPKYGVSARLASSAATFIRAMAGRFSDMVPDPDRAMPSAALAAGDVGALAAAPVKKNLWDMDTPSKLSSLTARRRFNSAASDDEDEQVDTMVLQPSPEQRLKWVMPQPG